MAMRRWGGFCCLVLVALLGAPALRAADESTSDKPQAEAPKSKAERTREEQDYELFKVFVDTLDQVERNYVQEVDRRELMEAAIQGLLTKLDPYSNYISPDEVDRFRDSLESQFGGIGIQITMDQGQLEILSPLVGTPAYRKGLHAGDAIIEIEGKSTDGISIDQAVKQLKGPAGTSVTIKVRSAFVGEVREVTLKRELIHVETVLGDRRKGDDTWDYMFDSDKKIAYVRITSFSRDTPKELRTALRTLKEQGVRGLVLDLRFNPGGLLNAAVEISDLFISSGKIVSTKGRNVEERVWEAHADGTYEGFPMVVLINRYSASASEILSACLQDHKRAIVVGERSWGKGSVQNVIDLEGGKSALKLTTASYWRPSGKNIHRFPDASESDEWGVSPDPNYEVKLDPSETRTMVDIRRRKDLLSWTRTAAEASSPSTEKKEPSDEEKKAELEEAEKREEDAKYVDPQLKRALDYLSAEIAKAQ